MIKRNLIATMGAAVLLCSCIPSVNPFYTDKDVVFDLRLLGEWQEKDKSDSPDVWKFEKSGDKGYKLTVTQKEGKAGKFDARLFKLREECFLDLIATDCDFATNQADLVGISMFPGHLLMRVSQPGSGLNLAFFKHDWLETYLQENPKALAHHVEDKRLILTAETRDLQKFVLEHLGEGELFDNPAEMVRKTNAAAVRSPN